jgi:hypothetical protein
VYDGEMDEPGKFGVELHTNYVISGPRQPGSPEQTASHHVLQVTPELSYGISKEWEAGMYFPPLARTSSGTVYSNGLRLRLKYVPEHGDEGFFWGINTEFGYSSRRVSDARWGGELRPILGFQKEGWTALINPILEFAVSDGVSKTPAFSPALKLSREINAQLAVGVEHYADLGATNGPLSWRQAPTTTYLAFDIKFAGCDLNLGIGKGNHLNEDKTVIKTILALPF